MTAALDPLRHVQLGDPEWPLVRLEASRVAFAALHDSDGTPAGIDAACLSYRAQFGTAPRWTGIWMHALSQYRKTSAPPQN